MDYIFRWPRPVGGACKSFNHSQLAVVLILIITCKGLEQQGTDGTCRGEVCRKRSDDIFWKHSTHNQAMAEYVQLQKLNWGKEGIIY